MTPELLERVSPCLRRLQPADLQFFVRRPERPDYTTTLEQPFAFFGRHAANDVHLKGEAVSQKHAYLQVVGRAAFIWSIWPAERG